MWIKKLFCLRNLFKLLLGFVIYLCLGIPEKIRFAQGTKDPVVEFISLFVLAVFIGLAVGFDDRNIHFKRITISLLGGITGGLLLGFLQIIKFSSLEVWLFFIPGFFVVIAKGLYYKSFLKIVLGVVGIVGASLAAIILFAIGTLLSRGWWGTPMLPALGELPLVVACLIMGWILIIGINLEDYWRKLP
ncbi:MAG: hypothetical protein ABIH71_00550 [Candidatus Omnitrophota bacterium]